jgi:ElaB/YqjD/DUF883 family membrane-anchored ribosome-binding protein
MRRLIFAVLILACCATPTAPTQIRPVKVTLLPDGAVARQTARALRSKRYLETVQQDPHELIRSQATAEASSPAKQVRIRAKEALEQSRAAFRNLRFDLAISRLSQAQAALVPVAETEQDYALLSRLALQLGINRLALRQEAEASEAFTFAFSLGYAGPQAGQHPPEVEAFIKDTQQRLSGSTHGGLTVTAQPAGCQVWID